MATKTKIAPSKLKLTLAKPIVAKTTIVKSKTRSSKPSVKRSVSKKTSKTKPEVILIDEVIAAPGAVLNLPSEISKEYLIVRRCENCAHMPMSSRSLVTLFSIFVVLLAVSILIQIGQINPSQLLTFATPYTQAASHVFIR